ncbi:BglG family transcription antiterminator [Haloimpatiens sp. FM7330]|uniref:BglG family transcription antiterminator n=1 Tax=Haloimpatiens sp. FM7330 TaxID=3298610 RepID=UPI003637E9B7
MINISSKELVKKKILDILLEKEEPVTVSEFAKLFSKSGRTIRNYLNEIESILNEKGIKLIKKPNVGIKLEVNEEEKAKLKREITDKEKNTEMYSSEYRRKYILKTLFKNKYTYTIQLLAEDLYCSKGTIVNDLVYVQEWLENRGLSLKRKPNQGLWIEGNEQIYRRAMMDLFHEIERNDNIHLEKEAEKLDYRIDFINYKKIKDLFPRIDIYKIQLVVQEAEKKLGYYFTDLAFINLITHIAITIERVKNEKEIKMEDKMFNNLKSKYEFEVAKWVIDRLSEEFKIKFPEAEIGYISLHMLGAKVQENSSVSNIDNLLLSTQNKELVELAKEIINLAGEILNVNLSNDKQLLTGLILHLRPTVVRLKHGLKLRNPMLERIKKEYTNIFGAAWACSSIFEKKLGILINEDEVGYIALHIAVAVNRISEKVKTVIVCSSGIGTSQLVASRLEKKLDEIDIIAVVSLNSLGDKLKEEADLIITTIPTMRDNSKVVYISNLVDDRDIFIIKNKIKQILIENSKNNLLRENTEKQITDSVIEEELCFIEEEKSDFVEIIKYYGKFMEEVGYAKKGFCENVLQREKKASTVIGKGIAIPHSTQDYVNESKICIIKLKNPVEWSKQKLNLIIMLCLKFQDINTTKGFFKKFYSVLNSETAINEIMQTDDKKQIINIFINGGIGND